MNRYVPVEFAGAAAALLLMGGCPGTTPPAAPGPFPQPGDVAALASYEANERTSNQMPDATVRYTVTDPGTIRTLFSGIETGTERDCSDLETKDSAYLYVKLQDGNRRVYTLFLLNSHLALNNERATCFFVNPAARAVVTANLQVQP
jgi:hypothetical protein